MKTHANAASAVLRVHWYNARRACLAKHSPSIAAAARALAALGRLSGPTDLAHRTRCAHLTTVCGSIILSFEDSPELEILVCSYRRDDLTIRRQGCVQDSAIVSILDFRDA